MEKESLEIEFEKHITQHQGLILKISHAFANGRYETRDLYQDIMLNLWRGYHTFNHQCNVSTWIYKVAFNTAISTIRKQQKDDHQPISKEMENLFQAEESNSEQIAELYDLIRGLDKIDRALVLMWLDNLSYQEIGEILGISKTNVATKLSRVKTKLIEMSNQ
ncbi:MAG: sigma-70 family RNA polymerase sigma factor [Bacteroidales bacterium]|nr:sigma-70 family RNA polymerase sigma factor [Bacteroidales bacterium]